MEVNAQLVIDYLVGQNRQLVAEIAILRAHLGLVPTPMGNDSEPTNNDPATD